MGQRRAAACIRVRGVLVSARMAETDQSHDALDLLRWYQNAGVDAALSDVPIDWLTRGGSAPSAGFHWPKIAGDRLHSERPLEPMPTAAPTAPPVSYTPRPTPPALDIRPRPQTPLAASEAETDARRIASGANSLEALEAALRAFDGCTLKATAKNLCFYRGASHARIMLIGEAPGRDEDIEGKPFVGRAGQLLDKMLAAIRLTEADVHITNIVYWRPPGNRTPTPQEALACRPFLERQIELVKPDFVVAVGGSAAKEVFGVSDGIMRLRGKWREIMIGGNTIAAIATLHPAYLLRAPAAKQMAWLDMLQISARLRG
jgi:uracil-DNA glycosylase